MFASGFPLSSKRSFSSLVPFIFRRYSTSMNKTGYVTILLFPCFLVESVVTGWVGEILLFIATDITHLIIYYFLFSQFIESNIIDCRLLYIGPNVVYWTAVRDGSYI